MADGLRVSKVISGSIAQEMEIEPGDILLQVNDKKIQDVLDLQYAIADEIFTLFIEKQNNEIWELEIEREPGEELGIEVCAISTKGLKKCNNQCVFCFVRQMPSGMRETLYDRDDDYRLSVTQGSYITLSNLSSQEFERIIDLHLSPLYISVHAWDAKARQKLMGNSKAGQLDQQIKRLSKAGLTLHTQIVLVPGYNDGDILIETVENLASYFPAVQSIGIVPVGLTKYRDELPLLRKVEKQEAELVIDQANKWQKKYKKLTGKNLVYLSDEFYVTAERSVPEVKDYDNFPQLENGIGMTAKINSEIATYFPYLPDAIPSRNVHLVTGTSAAGFFVNWAKKLRKIKGLNLKIHSIDNDFFGSTVTVAGLLTAQDIAHQLANLQGDYFLIPKVMLKADEAIFLDGYDLKWLEKQINGSALIIENNGRDFLEGVLGRELEVLEND